MILVTGMHRSGTSSIAMIMESLGIDFGRHDEFYGADRWNERGYFERADVIDMNSRLITGFPRTQGRISGALSQFRYLFLPGREVIERRAQEMREDIEDLADQLGGLAVKDPRFCLTLGAWEGSSEAVVVCIRHPIHVARSLHRRQRVPRRTALKFWNHHIDMLLRDLAHDSPHSLYVDFDALGRPEEAEQEIERIRSFFGLNLSATEAHRRFKERFEPGLRHFGGRVDEGLPEDTTRLWNELRARHRIDTQGRTV